MRWQSMRDREKERGSVKEKDRECERVRQLKLLFISCCCCWKPKVIHLLTPFLLYSGVQLVSPLAINTKCAAGSVPGLSCAGVCRCGVCQWCASWAHFLTPFAFRLWLGKQVTWAFQQRPNCLRLMTGPAVKRGRGSTRCCARGAGAAADNGRSTLFRARQSGAFSPSAEGQ